MATPFKDPARSGWRVVVTMTIDGVKHRRHIRGRTRAEVQDVAESVRTEMRAGILPAGGKVTVSQWIESWIRGKESAGRVRPKTIVAYRVDQAHIARSIGDVRLDKLTPEHVERLYADTRDAARSTPRGRGASDPGTATVLHVRGTLRAALNSAMRRGRIAKNVVELAETPRDQAPEIEPLSIDEVGRVLRAARTLGCEARWATSIVTGMRQGEVLGLQWDDVDLLDGTVRVRRALARRPWRHGCQPGKSCGRKPQRCPQGIRGGLVASELKTRASRRTVSIPAQLVEILTQHRRAQRQDRMLAGELWEQGPGGGWVFCSETGKPVDPRNDLRGWTRVVAEAGIGRRVRIHDLRHTATTLALVEGTPARLVQAAMGWGSPAMLTRYGHPVEEAMRQSADRVGAAVFGDRGTG